MLDTQERVVARTEIRPAVSVATVRRVLPFALAMHDAIFIYASLAVAYWIRYDVSVGPTTPGASALPFSEYQGIAALALSVMLAALFLKGAYRTRMQAEAMDDIVRVISAATTTIAVIIVISFMLHDLAYSRGVIIYLWLFMIGFVSFGRILFRSFRGLAHRKGWGARRLLVVGASEVGKMIMQSVVSRPDLGYQVAGFVDRRGADRVPDFGRFDRLGSLRDIPSLIEEHQIDELVIALPGSAHEEIWPVVHLCEEANVALKLVPDMFHANPARIQADAIAGIPVLDVQEHPSRRMERLGKRLLDVTVGGLVSLISLPAVGVLALVVKLDSPGPAFIRQERVGKNGRRFWCMKLRTMRVDAENLLPALEAMNEAKGPIFKIRHDPRLTRVGRIIRRLSLDELPQVWNVVRGDMSLVGPRPPLPREVVKYEPWQMRRLETTPGMTGLWQVSGRSNLGFDEMVMMDIMYVDNWSLSLDIKIIFKTFSAVLMARGAY